MDFLRSIEEDLHGLIHETKKKFPVVRDAADKGLETVVLMRQQYAQSMRVEAAPGPGHAVFKSDAILRPFLLACNHATANPKLLISCFNSIQRLVSWDAITTEAVGNILRVLHIQAEHTSSQDIQLKLLQTLLQLLTLAFNRCDEQMTNEDLIGQAMWICLHLQAQANNPITANTAAMTVRQIVTMVFDNVVQLSTSAASPELKHSAKNVGFLVFQDLCLMSREEAGVWLKRTTFSKLLGVELVEAVLTSHSELFRTDVEFRSMLKQHIKTLVTMNLDSLLMPANATNPSMFPLLLRIMRLAATVLANFTSLLPDECVVIWLALLEIVATGTYSPSSPPAKAGRRTERAAVALTAPALAPTTATPSAGAPVHPAALNYVAWPVLLAMEVVSKACHEPEVLPALALYPGHALLQVARTVAAVVATSPPADYKPPHDTMFYRSGLEFLNDAETPPLQPFYHCLRLAVVCMAQMVAVLPAPTLPPLQMHYMVAATAPFLLNAFVCTLRFCRDAEVVNLVLKALHGLATAEAARRPDPALELRPVGVACLQALCVFSLPIVPAARMVKCITGTGQPSMVEYSAEELGPVPDEPLLTWKEVQAMKTLFRTVHTIENDLNTAEWRVLLEGFEVLVALSALKQKAKGVHTKMGTGPQALKVEDEDVEQQLVMLGFSVLEYFTNSTNEGILRPEALIHVLEALRLICLGQLQAVAPTADSPPPPAPSVVSDTPLHAALQDLLKGEVMLAWDVLAIPYAQHLRVYDQTLGLSSSPGTAFTPSFALRLFVQLAKQHPLAWSFVMHELVALSCAVSSGGAGFQAFTTDAAFQLMQAAMLSPTTMAQTDICSFMTLLIQSESMKERTLAGLLDLLQSCGHLLSTGWPTVLATLTLSADFDTRCQVVAFKSVRLVVDDLLGNMPLEHRKACIGCVGAFAAGATDVNVSLTAVNALWSIADAIAKQATDVDGLWPRAMGELRRIAADPRPEVRNCAINTLFGMAATHGSAFGLIEWTLCLDDTVLPLGATLAAPVTVADDASASVLRTHHSRDSVAKQYDESRVLVLAGLARVMQTHGAALMAFEAWFPSLWRELLAYIEREAAHIAVEVALAAVQTLLTLLQVAATDAVDAAATPLRAGVGMRMVDGSLSATPEAPTSTVRRPSGNAPRDPAIWADAFALLLRIAVARPVGGDKDADVGAAVVHAAVQLYNQCRHRECAAPARVHELLGLLNTCMERYAIALPATITGGTTNSVHARVLNAYDDCGYFVPTVHAALLEQVLGFLGRATALHSAVLIKHTLATLAKLVENVDGAAVAAASLKVLRVLQPLLDTKTQDVATTAATLTSVEKAALGLWKPAVPVLNALATHALPVAGAQLAPALFAAIEGVLGPAPARDDAGDDEALELSVLETLVGAMVGRVPPTPEGTARFMALLTASSGRRPGVASACVQQLIALGSVANTNASLRHACRVELLALTNEALGAYLVDSTGNRSRVLTLLSTLGASPLSPRNVLVLFPSLCACISCDDAEIRRWIQQILLESNVAPTCLALLRDETTP
ncbi:hypothetical protein ACHHYP_07821 [Achlya hypogyna]|uniref:Protein MON2 homolog n=1 Tax=Achlya hypogyna TaxID=1202772 RepID=A0A1V9YQK5_ACHHY|nr:hypothetical protein ACHHYP_07821 [Achlya hypogyna]